MAAAVAFVVLASFASTASAMEASGEFTRAEANEGWTQGSVAGSVSWEGCEISAHSPDRVGTPQPPEFPEGLLPDGCRITPYVTVAPGTDPAECSSSDRTWPHSAGTQQLAWEGPTFARAGSATFDVTTVPLPGVPGQLACLSVLELREERPQCSFGLGVACPMWIAWVPTYRVAAAALLSGPEPAEEPSTVEPESESGEVPDPGLEPPPPTKPGTEPNTTSPPDGGQGADDPGAAPPVPRPGRGQRRVCARAHRHSASQDSRDGRHRGHGRHRKCASVSSS